MQVQSRTTRRRRGLLVTGVTAAIVLLSASAAIANVKTFQSPSGNIGCAIAQGGGFKSARCDIRTRTWQAPPKPHSCHLDYGNGLEVDKHAKGHFTCAGDTVLGQGPVLAYGDSITFDGFKCKSKTTGMRCRNLKSGHGFKISIARAVRF